MNFDHFRRPLNNDCSCYFGYGGARQCSADAQSAPCKLRRAFFSELTTHMTSQKKIEANRKNAKKSTGPKTVRGRALARNNAIKHGLFAAERIIAGEDEEDYQALSAKLFAELKPSSTIEEMIVDQILGDMWRLRRLELAEQTYLGRAREGIFERFAKSLTLDELDYAKNLIVATHDVKPSARSVRRNLAVVSPESDQSTNGNEAPGDISGNGTESVQQKLARAFDLGAGLLEGLIPATNEVPYATLEQMRRSLVRDILRKYASLAEIQGRGLPMVSREKE